MNLQVSTEYAVSQMDAAEAAAASAHSCASNANIAEEHWLQYLLQSLTGEGCISHTSCSCVRTSLSLAPDKRGRPDVKVQNMDAALALLFDRATLRARPELSDKIVLSSSFIKLLHRTVCAGLMSGAGNFRFTMAMAGGTGWVYLAPHLIPTVLARVLVETLQQCEEIARISDREERVLQRVKLTASFLTVFLHVHPFGNGNGRVARLLASYMLREVSAGPLWFSAESRAAYLLALQDARAVPQVSTPDNLATYILQQLANSKKREDPLQNM